MLRWGRWSPLWKIQFKVFSAKLHINFPPVPCQSAWFLVKGRHSQTSRCLLPTSARKNDLWRWWVLYYIDWSKKIELKESWILHVCCSCARIWSDLRLKIDLCMYWYIYIFFFFSNVSNCASVWLRFYLRTCDRVYFDWSALHSLR